MDGGEERLGLKGKSIGREGGGPLTMVNRFAELMLVVGIDENTGLVPLGGHGLEVRGWLDSYHHHHHPHHHYHYHYQYQYHHRRHQS
ncbi:hypothetical protein ACOMHN_039402 [Nucella lapillus]